MSPSTSHDWVVCPTRTSSLPIRVLRDNTLKSGLLTAITSWSTSDRPMAAVLMAAG
ncbi:UNVERIFIED_CONTAM: hypothetical protein GTU68_056502 [Idotea baltica]|nr:hypothetical protein [Idotea baltica]